MNIFYTKKYITKALAAVTAAFTLIMSCFSYNTVYTVNAYSNDESKDSSGVRSNISKRMYSSTKMSSAKTSNAVLKKISALTQIYDKGAFEENRLIVKLSSYEIDLTEFGADEVVAAPDNIYIMQFSSADLADNALTEIRKNPCVVYAETDKQAFAEGDCQSKTSSYLPASASVPEQAASQENDKYISWGAEYIGIDKYADYLKKLSITNRVTVAVVDSGIDTDHDEFKDKISKLGHDYIDGDNIPDDEMGHGSHTAGIIADLTRDFDNITLLPIKVFNKYGTGSSLSIGYAVRAAANDGADIINLSLSCSSTDFVNDCVKYAVSKGCLIVFAAGNNSYLCDKCPVDINDTEGITVVSSINSEGDISSFSNFSEIVDVAAPGENINGINMGGGYTLKSGTSMAAPHISAAAALLKCEYPTASPAMLERMIKSYCTDAGDIGFDMFYGFGIVDLSLAVDQKTKTAVINNADITYTVKNNEATLRKVVSDEQSYTVEQSIGGIPVTRVAESAFFEYENLKSLTLPDSIEYVYPAAFSRCNLLESINARGDSLCSSGGVLYSNDFSKLIAYPPAKKDKSFTIPESVKSLETGAFKNCTNLSTVTLNKDIEDLATAPFGGCTGLTRIYANADSSYFTDINGVLYDKQKTKIIKYPVCSPIINITLPQTVTEICSEAFMSGVNIKSVYSYNALRRISARAFSGCENLTSVSVFNGLMYIDKMAFWRAGVLKSINIPKTVVSIDSFAFAECKSLTNVTVSNNISTLGSGAFYKCISLASAVYSSPSAEIGYRVFAGCTSLKNVTIDDGAAVIGRYMFFGCSSLDSVIVPSSVKTVCAAAFGSCTSLKSIDINEGVASMQGSVFSGCTSLGYVALPSTLKSMGSKIFSDCTILSGVMIPDSVENIGSFAFLRCTNLRTCSLGNAVESIPEYCFDGCSGLEYVFIWGNTEQIYLNAFDGCTSLIMITLTDKNDRYTSVSGVLIDKTSSELLLYPPKKNSVSYTVPAGIKKLGENAFKNNISLASLIIPSSVEEIGAGCFVGVSSLRSLTIGDIINNHTFFELFPDSVGLLETINITASFNEIREGMFEKCSALAEIYIPSTVTHVGERAFANCASLKSVVLPDSVTYIGDRAFYRCDNLVSVNIPDRVKVICPYTFYGCKSLKDVFVPDAILDIGERAFYGCSSISEINIPIDIAAIRPYTFYGCRSLKAVDIPYGVTEIGDYAFYSCTSMTDITIPQTVKKLGGYSFYGMSKLKSVTLSEGITEIGSFAFDGCTSLTDINIPQSVTLIGFNCFNRCSSITQISLGSISVITRNTFLNCSSLKTVYIPDSITDINESAFNGCTGLQSITGGRGLKNIGKLAFCGCKSLRSWQPGDSIAYISPDAFTDCTNINLLCSAQSYIHTYAASNNVNYTVVFTGDNWAAYVSRKNDIFTDINAVHSVTESGDSYKIIAYSNDHIIYSGISVSMMIECPHTQTPDMYVIKSIIASSGESEALEYYIDSNRYCFDLSVFDTVSVEKGIAGDANLDGRYDIQDVECLLDILTGKQSGVSVQSRLADINGDGDANLMDAYTMLVQNNT